MKLCVPLSVLVVLVVFVVGCAQLKKASDDYVFCSGDSECMSKVRAAQSVVRSAVSGVPGNNVVVEVVGGVASCLVGVVATIVYGRRLKKKKNE